MLQSSWMSAAILVTRKGLVLVAPFRHLGLKGLGRSLVYCICLAKENIALKQLLDLSVCMELLCLHRMLVMLCPPLPPRPKVI